MILGGVEPPMTFNILIMNKTEYYLVYNDDGSYAGTTFKTEDSFTSIFQQTESRKMVRISKRAYNRIKNIERDAVYNMCLV